MSRFFQRLGCIVYLVILSTETFGLAQEVGLNGKFALDRSPILTEAQHPMTWRDVLMEEARRRTALYADQSLLDDPQTKSGVTIQMMKKDKVCGGVKMPVVYTDFTIPDVRPVDIFNVLTRDRKGEIQKCGNVVRTSAGEFPGGAIRAWSTLSTISMVGKIVFTEWEVVDVDVENEEFWLVTSTLQNRLLIEEHPLEQGASEADDCLASYHITKDADGNTHVLGSRHLNIHSLDWLPIHFAFQNFPPAWEQTIICVEMLRDETVIQNSLNWTKTQLEIPDWMLGTGDLGFLPPGVVVDEGAFSRQDIENVTAPNSHVASMVILGIGFALCYCFCCNSKVTGTNKMPRGMSWAERLGFSRSIPCKCGSWSQVHPEPLDPMDTETDDEDTDDEGGERIYNVVSPRPLAMKSTEQQDLQVGEPCNSADKASLESDQVGVCACMPGQAPSFEMVPAESAGTQNPQLGKPCNSTNISSLPPLEPTLDSDQADVCACMPRPATSLEMVPAELADRQDPPAGESVKSTRVAPAERQNADLGDPCRNSPSLTLESTLESDLSDTYGCMPHRAHSSALPSAEPALPQNPDLGKPCKSTNNPSLMGESTLDSGPVDTWGCMPERAGSTLMESAESVTHQNRHFGKPCENTNNPSLTFEPTLDSEQVVDSWGCMPDRAGSSVMESAKSAAQRNPHVGKPCESTNNPSLTFESTLDSDQVVDTWGCMPDRAGPSVIEPAESEQRQNPRVGEPCENIEEASVDSGTVDMSEGRPSLPMESMRSR